MYKRLSVLMVAAMLPVLAACGEDEQGGSTTAAERPAATETTAKTPTAADEKTAAEKARAQLKAKAKANARTKDRRAGSGASGAPATGQETSDNAPVQPLSDAEMRERLGKLAEPLRPMTSQELVRHCKETAASIRKAPESERQQLISTCEEAASGSRPEIKAAAVEVCRAAVASELPKEAPLYDVALDACKRTGDAS